MGAPYAGCEENTGKNKEIFFFSSFVKKQSFFTVLLAAFLRRGE